MKRFYHAVIWIFLLAFTLLFSNCAPAPYMVATLTRLPFAGTPPTSTPYPTPSPRATLTPSPIPSALEAVTATPTGIEYTNTPTGKPTASATLTPAPATATAACPPFAFDTTLPDPNQPELYIGRHYDSTNLPEGANILSAGLLENHSYSLTNVEVNGRIMYWLEKQVCYDALGVPYWEIADALTLPSLDKNLHEVTASFCFSGEQKLPSVIAYGRYDPSKPAATVVKPFVGWPIQIEQAWEIKDTFIPLNPAGLTCMLQKP